MGQLHKFEEIIQPKKSIYPLGSDIFVSFVSFVSFVDKAF